MYSPSARSSSVSRLLLLVSFGVFGGIAGAAEQLPPALTPWRARGLRDALLDPDPGIRRVAARVIVSSTTPRIGPQAADILADTVPQVAELLEDDGWRIPDGTARALGEMGEHAKDFAPHIAELLKDERRWVRGAAAIALGEMGEHAKRFVPQIVELLEDEEGSVRQAATRALGEMGKHAKDFAPHIAELLKDENERVRGAAARALGEMGEHATDFALHVTRLLRDESWRVRTAAASALGEMGEHAKDFAPHVTKLLQQLVELLKHESWRVRRGAAIMLGDMGKHAAEFAPHIAESLKDEDEEVRTAAATALGEMGEHAKDFAPRIAELLKDENEEVRTAAATALGGMGEHAKDFAPQIAELLKDEDVRGAAASALAEMGEHAKDFVPQIAELLETGSMRETYEATRALGELGKHAAEFAPHIAELLEDDDWTIQGHAALALGKMGQDAKDFVPQITELLKDTKPDECRAAVREALVRIAELDWTRALETSDLPVFIAILTVAHRYADVRDDAIVLAYELGGRAPIADCDKTTSDLVYWLARRPNDPQEIVQQLQSAEEMGTEDWIELLTAFEAVWEVSSREENPELREQIAKRVSTIAAAVGAKNWSGQLPMLQDWHQRLASHTNEAARIGKVIEDINSRDRILLWTGRVAATLSVHAVFWLGLIFAYPRSSKVQALFFWNPWVRRIAGLGYVGILLSWLPPLQRIVFAPFRTVLLSDAALHEIRSRDFFPDLEVLDPATGEKAAVLDAVPKIEGQILLEGESGFGKSMLVRWLVRESKRVTVFLPATKCAGGVLEAIAAKLEGVAGDEAFLKSLIYSGAMDICIDGLNEVDPQTVERICQFVEKFFHGNVILTTQPMHWTPPATARRLELQPLPASRVKEFLYSRAPTLPADAPVRDRAFIHACDEFWKHRHDAADSDEMKSAIDHTLSNPMDLTSASELISQGQRPDLSRLQEQQFQVMQAEYCRNNQGATFPMARFAETVYRMRLGDERELTEDPFRNELECLEKYKMVVVRRDHSPSAGETRRWYFRHDRTMEFFLVQGFLHDRERQRRHVDEPRFRGVYALLADLLEAKEAESLKEHLVRHAVKTNDVSTLTPFVEQLDRRIARSETRPYGNRLLGRSQVECK